MSRLVRALLCVAAATLFSAPAGAQIAGHPIEASVGAGFFHYDVRAYTKDGAAFTGAVGWRLAPWLSLEGDGLFNSSKADPSAYPSEPGRSFTWAGLDARWGLRASDGVALPFVLTGIGYGKSHWEADPAVPGGASGDLARGTPTLGLGLLVNLKNQRTYLRFQARDFMFQERDQTQRFNHIALTAGVQYAFGGKPRDVDHDGVRDWLDKCPDTPIGAKVDGNGCPIDSDGDGVYDGLDKCSGTPKGCKIDANGCPLDADGDGVCDGLDQCPNTPLGAKVDEKGCPIDSDGDGVYDGLDKCPGTPKGCTVDSVGCSTDSDGDGVCDGVDQCPNTPPGLKVTPTGCPIEISTMERQILDTGVLRQSSRNFASGKSDLLPNAYPALDSLALVLQQYPALRIEIGGHTDNVGTKAKNQTLSEARAKVIFDYMTQKHPNLAANLTWKGYGSTMPIAPNTTAAGKAANRRVEFKVMNPEALKVEREKRRYLLQGETAPPPSVTPPPNVTTPAPPDTTKHCARRGGRGCSSGGIERCPRFVCMPRCRRGPRRTRGRPQTRCAASSSRPPGTGRC